MNILIYRAVIWTAILKCIITISIQSEVDNLQTKHTQPYTISLAIHKANSVTFKDMQTGMQTSTSNCTCKNTCTLS